MKVKILTLLISATMFSCGTEKPVNADPSIEVINVEVPENLIVEYGEVFGDFNLIPLETNEASIIENIDRIVVYKKQFFILDKSNNRVIVFDDQGRFIRKIQKEGKGPGEYQALMDFTIDDKREQLILHSHRPYKIFYYDIEGNFLKEENLDWFYKDIMYQDEQLILTNDAEEKEFSIFLQDFASKEIRGCLPVGEVPNVKNLPNHSFSTAFPYALKSMGTHVFFPFSSTIYQVKSGQVVPRYKIDFGGHNLPEKYFHNGMMPQEVYKEAIEHGYGFFISHFRESKDFISFIYGGGVTVVYAKETKKASVFHFARHKEEGFAFQGHFGYDGFYEDNTIMCIIEGHRFRHQMDIFKANPERWKDASDKFKEIDGKIRMESNPILMMAKLKDPDVVPDAEL